MVLLHGFPSASHMFRELIPQLAGRFRIIAPDLPGFGKSDMPAPEDFGYTFEHLTDVIDRLIGKDPSPANREAVGTIVQPQTTIWQYTHGVPDVALVSPDGYGLDSYYLARPGAEEIQLDLLLDYASNVALYPAFHHSAPANRACSPCGAVTTVLPAGRGPKPSSATSPTPISVCWTPATSPGKPMPIRSRPPSASSSADRYVTRLAS